MQERLGLRSRNLSHEAPHQPVPDIKLVHSQARADVAAALMPAQPHQGAPESPPIAVNPVGGTAAWSPGDFKLVGQRYSSAPNTQAMVQIKLGGAMSEVAGSPAGSSLHGGASPEQVLKGSAAQTSGSGGTVSAIAQGGQDSSSVNTSLASAASAASSAQAVAHGMDGSVHVTPAKPAAATTGADSVRTAVKQLSSAMQAVSGTPNAAVSTPATKAPGSAVSTPAAVASAPLEQPSATAASPAAPRSAVASTVAAAVKSSPVAAKTSTPAAARSGVAAGNLVSSSSPAVAVKTTSTTAAGAPAAAVASASASASAVTTASKALEQAPTAAASALASKPGQPTPAEVLKTSAAELSAAAKAGVEAARALIAAAKDKKRPVNLTLDGVVAALFFGWLGIQALAVRLLSPAFVPLACSLLLGVGLGLGLSFLYYYNKKEKAELNQMLGLHVGMKGLQYLSGHIPSWLSYVERERLEWVNAMLMEVWPFVDKAVCKKVKEEVEAICADVLRSQKLPLKRIGFKQLTFGDAPFRIENIWVSEHAEHGLEMEVGVRWCGDANITLAIELTGEATKMCPRVTDITFVANLKIRLAPLCDKIPGFGGIMFCMTKPPRIGYNLNVGKALGGSAISNVIKPVIQDIVQYQIVNMLVWPQRLVIPVPLPDLLKDDEVQAGVAKMALRNRGILKVVVKKATGLLAADINLVGRNSSDPFVELTTDGQHVARTKALKSTLEPVWEQTFWLTVQEPTNQLMKVTVWDKDFSGNEIIGRSLVKLAPVCKKEMQAVDSWYFLGPGDWADPAGCGKGSGKINLEMTYRSHESFLPHEPKDAELGVLIVTIRKVEGMRFNVKDAVTLYCVVKCNDETWKSGHATAKGGKDHLFNFRNVKEFYDVRFDMDVNVTVMLSASVDDEVGSFELPITDIAEAQDYNPVEGKVAYGYVHRRIKLEDSEGYIHVSLRYVPQF